MNKNQKLLLKALDKFIAFCNKHKLNWIADGGTLLGTIRDHKLIEWDDDIDIMMPRKDFDRLSNIMYKNPRQIGKNLFFQDPMTDSEYMNIHARLRIDNTLNISKREHNIKSHKGIFIDIYPIDYVADEEQVTTMLRNICKKTDCEEDKPSILKQTQPFIAYMRFQQILRHMNDKSDKKYAFPACFWRYSKYKGMKFDAKIFELSTTTKLKGLRHRLNIPFKYEEVLVAWYGEDYMTPKHEASFHGK